MHLLCKYTGRKRILPAPFKVRKGFVKFLKTFGTSNKILS
jgi:hypothetical protein